MRTTLDIDEDLLAVAQDIAHREGTTTDEVGLRMPRGSLSGIEPFAARAGTSTTNEQVNALRDVEGI